MTMASLAVGENKWPTASPEISGKTARGEEIVKAPVEEPRATRNWPFSRSAIRMSGYVSLLKSADTAVSRANATLQSAQFGTMGAGDVAIKSPETERKLKRRFFMAR